MIREISELEPSGTCDISYNFGLVTNEGRGAYRGHMPVNHSDVLVTFQDELLGGC